jgi:hypothetical protein
VTESSFRNDVRDFVIQNFMFGQGNQLQDNESFLESGLIDSTGVERVCGYVEQKLWGVSRRAG